MRRVPLPVLPSNAHGRLILHTNTWKPPVPPELIAIVAMTVTLAGLMVAIWRDARAHTDRGLAELRAEMRNQRTDIQSLRQEVRSDIQSFRQEVRADIQGLREESRADIGEVRADNQRLREEFRAESAHVRDDLADLRKDVQALTERTSRLEGVIEGLFARRDRHDDAA